MKDQFVPYEESLELKEIGFNEPCFALFSLGLEKNNYTELQFKIDHSYAHSFGAYIPIMDNFFPPVMYNSDLHVPTAPLWQQAFDWFRETHDLHAEILKGGKQKFYMVFIKEYIYENNEPKLFPYEEARLAALRKLIEIVKTEK
jgi:hypothetical protein